MRRSNFALLSLALVACQPASQPSAAGNDAKPNAKPEPAPNAKPEPAPLAKPEPVVRKDLLAEELPPIPELELAPTTELSTGELTFPEGTDELAPRAAVALRGGLLLVGQGYLGRTPGQPPQTWRWTGLIPSEGEPRSTLYDPGAIRAAIADGQGGALVTGTRGTGFEVRGWFATVTPDGTIQTETALDTPSSTEMFDLIPGRAEGELAVVGGYVDAQGWLISLDAAGNRRWEKYIGSYGYTQVRGLARLDSGDLLAIGSRAQKFGESWSGKAPGDGGETAAPDDVEQTKIEIAGADPNQILRAIVDLGEAGYVALGTAKRNHIQAHDQVVAVGFDRAGKQTWSRVVGEVRVTDVLGVRAHAGAAEFVVTVPQDASLAPVVATAIVAIPADPSAAVSARRLTEFGWSGAGYIEGVEAAELVVHRASAAGIEWRRISK